MGKGLIKQVVGYSSQMIYARMIGDKETEGSIVIEMKSKGKKDKSDAKAQDKDETTAKTVEMPFNKKGENHDGHCLPSQCRMVHRPNAGYVHNHCKEVAQDTFYDVPVLIVIELAVDVICPKPIKCYVKNAHLSPGSLARTFPRKYATQSLRSRLSPRPSKSASPA